MKKMEYILIGMLIWIISSAATVSAENNYEWDNVPYGGGGFVTGLTFHPKEKDLVYARTDVGGLYKWDAENNRWHQLCDMFSLNDANLYGIDGVAIDPNDSNVVYICAGKYRKERAIAYGMYIEGKSKYNACDVLKSTDKGNSWQATGLNVDFNGNGTNRHFGEIIAVDPNNSNNIYVLSRDNKLYCSDNGAETWNECAGFPRIPIQGNENNEKEGYARIVVIDPSSVSEGGSKRLYVGVYNGYGVYMSDDMGQTWTDITGENGPKSPTAMKITSSGKMLLSGRVSVSAGVNKETGYPTIFVMPVKSGGYYSRDMGQTWTASEGEPENLISSRFAWSYNFSSDRVTPDVFYGYANGNFYVSSDGGASFNQTVSGLPVYNRSFVRAAPYMQGTVWVALGFNGLYTSSDYGTTMNRLSDVTRAYMIAFGKPADGRTNPTAFLYGEVNNETGIFMSVDMGGSWIRINDDNHMVGDEPTCIGADRQEFGVVYVGTNGRGFTYGRPVKAVNISGGEIKADIPATEKNDDTVKVFLNGKHILFDTQPEFINDRVSVPIRKIAEAMGAEIEWYPTGNSAMVQLKDKAIYIPNNEFWILVNNEQYYLDIATYMKDNRLFIPLRSFAEIFGCEVSWDGDNRCVWIATGKEGEQ